MTPPRVMDHTLDPRANELRSPAVGSAATRRTGPTELLGAMQSGAGVPLTARRSRPDLEVPQGLRRYPLTRWQRNARVQARSLRNGRIFHAVGPVRWGRDLSLRMLGARVLDVPWLYRGDGAGASAL